MAVQDMQKTTFIAEKKARKGMRLIVLTGEDFFEYDLSKVNKDRIVFGRDNTICDIVIQLPTVSAAHGQIKIENGEIYVADTGSTNGLLRMRGQRFEYMQPRKYYKKEKGEWILRIEGADKNQRSSILVFTDSMDKSAWKSEVLPEGITTIGRSSANRIVLDSPGISRQHAAIMRKADRYALADNGSMNGVYVNGMRITGTREIFNRDVIRIAGTLVLLLDGKLIYQNSASGATLSLINISKKVGAGVHRKKILQHVYCDIESNEFVAIIGGSGAGKTTVMNAMSGFDDDIMGDVYCNGVDLRKNFSSMKNMIGFVPQQDIIYENLTLRKMLTYTARIKMPSDTSPVERQERIRRVLEMVELTAHADTYIRKLSGGQKKRASIAVEMLADPELFFLDEPTSGLDPNTEQALMHTLADVSKKEGKTIIMVTHTTQSIHLCDKVIFMGPGGKICYCGSPKNITEHFGTDDLVEVYDMLVQETDKWNDIYLKEYMEYREQSLADVVVSERADGGTYHSGHTRQVSAIRQLGVLIARYTELIWNDRQRMLMLFLQPIAIAFLLGIVAVDGTFVNAGDTQSILFALSCSGIWIGLFNTIQEICKERAILKREYMGNLKLWTYIISKYVVQGVICLIQSTLITSIFLKLMEHYIKEGVFIKPGFEVWITMILTIYASAAMGLIVSAFMKNSDRAMTMAPFVLIVQLLFSGVLFDLSGIAKLISKLTVSRWSMECLGNISNINSLPSKLEVEYPDFILPQTPDVDFYVRGGTHLRHTWEILAFIAALGVVLSIIALRNLKKDQR